MDGNDGRRRASESLTICSFSREVQQSLGNSAHSMSFESISKMRTKIDIPVQMLSIRSRCASEARRLDAYTCSISQKNPNPVTQSTPLCPPFPGKPAEPGLLPDLTNNGILSSTLAGNAGPTRPRLAQWSLRVPTQQPDQVRRHGCARTGPESSTEAATSCFGMRTMQAEEIEVTHP